MDKKKILITDDSGLVLRNMKAWLEDEFQVVLANSGELAIKYLTTEKPDLIILDIMMPGMDGFETYAEIRNMENGMDVPIVFLSGAEDSEKELHALELGATDFISKPIQPKIMINRIQRILSLEEYNHHIEAVIENQRRQLETLTLEAITTIAGTIDAKDKYTRGHSDRVAAYAVRLGRRLGMNEKELDQLHTLGLLHDIGKIGIPDHILFKDSRLEDDEFAIMKTHTTIGGEILATIKSIPHISDGAKYHHERYDGHGYPEGLSGEAIPLTARIISVGDALDAMTSNRVYRKHMNLDLVKEEIRKGRGSQFDPKLADLLLEMMEEDPNFIIVESEES